MILLGILTALAIGMLAVLVIVGPKNLACWLGLHGRTLGQLHSNRYHTTSHCSHCEREVIRWAP